MRRSELSSPIIHITGASGSGVTTLGSALSRRFGVPHLDTDDYYWASTGPKFTVTRPVEERLSRLRAAFIAAGPQGCVLSGSVGAWADPIVPMFAMVVFLTAPIDVRVERLKAREAHEFAEAIAPGNARHQEHEAFIAWAAAYDTGTEASRTRARHEVWLANLTCPVLRLDGTRLTSELSDAVKASWCALRERDPQLRR